MYVIGVPGSRLATFKFIPVVRTQLSGTRQRGAISTRESCAAAWGLSIPNLALPLHRDAGGIADRDANDLTLVRFTSDFNVCVAATANLPSAYQHWGRWRALVPENG
jgi:hypothetical protein